MIDESRQWLTLAEAAETVGRSVRTLRRWVQEGHLVMVVGRVSRARVLEVERRMRAARRDGVRAEVDE